MKELLHPDLLQLCREEFGQKLQQVRSYLHRTPEVGWNEHATTAFLRRELTQLGLEPVSLGVETGVAALLQGAHPGKTVVLRADIDALPVEELTGAEDASRNSGVMHACGHDIHATALLGAAMLLCRLRQQLHGNVLFLFQPAEECPHGAETIIQKGFFDRYRPDGFFGLHVWPHLPLGQVGIREGAVFAGKDSFHIRILGKGGHGSAPYSARNPIPAACALVGGIQSIVGQDLLPMDPAILSVGCIQGGTCDNVIPDECTLLGSIRYFSSLARSTIIRRLEELAGAHAAAYGCTAQVEIISDAPAVVNSGQMCRLMEQSARSIFGESGAVNADPATASEDFSLYGDLAPIGFALFGVGTPGQPEYPLHNPRFYPDSSVLAPAAAYMADTALRFLQQEG